MATLQSYILALPKIYQLRYSTQFTGWLNDLLGELADEGIMPEANFECGFPVEDKVWVTPPSGLREIQKIFNPQNEGMAYNFRQVNGRIKLLGAEVDENTDPDTVSAFSSYAVGSVKVNIADAVADQFKGYLLVISSGTYAGRTYILSGNDASDGGLCKINFMLPLSTAFSATTAITGYLLHPNYWIMIRYTGSWPELASDSESVPIDASFQRRIVSAYLTYRVLEEVAPSSDDAIAAKKAYKIVLSKQKQARRSIRKPIAARYSPGFDQLRSTGNNTVTYESELQTNV